MFRFDWSKFNAKIGLIFMIGVLVVGVLLGGRVEFSVMTAGISALLAWCTVILAPSETWRRHVMGLTIYLVAGVALTMLAAKVAPHDLARLASMVIVTFAGYMMLLRGLHLYLVAWCLVYWFLLAPLFLGSEGLQPVLLGHAIGVGLVIALNSLKPVWNSAVRDAHAYSEPDAAVQEKPSVWSVASYAAVVALSIAVGMVAGMRWLSSDPTLVANATINMISPTLKQTWIFAVERLICGAAGVMAGFYFGSFFPGPLAENIVIVVFSFLALGAIYVNMSLLVGFLFFIVAYPWGRMQSDVGHILANEKLISELVGVAIAVVAIAILTRLQSRFQVRVKNG
jgi:hypothetical protein